MKQNLRFIFMTLLCAVFSAAWGETATLTNANIVAAGAGANGYQTWTIQDGNGNTWNAYAIKNKHSNATSAYHYLQIKKYDSSTAYYIQVPEFGTKITSITMTVSSSSQTMTGGGNSATLFFSNSNSTSAAGAGVASGTGASSVTIDCSSLDLNTGYITASGAVRIWDVEVTYEEGSVTPTVAVPTFNPDGSGKYPSALEVTIESATDGATIYYTTDGNDPTTSSSVYTEPVSITKSGTTLKAMAVKEGMNNSSIRSASYVIMPDAPKIEKQDDNVIITAAEGLTIYYTSDGITVPTKESNVYTSPIPLTATVTIQAIAFDIYDNASELSSRTIAYSNVRPHPKNINSNYFVKVIDPAELEDGDAILFVNEDDGQAMSTTQNNNNRGATGVNIIIGSINYDVTSNVQKVILTGEPDAWYFSVDGGFLYAASSKSNYLRTEEIPDDNAKATISFEEGNAIITFQGTNERNILKYNPNNNGDPLFSCYASTSTNQATTQIYKEVPIETVTISEVGYSTLYYGTENLVVPAGVTAYTYKANGEKMVVSKTYGTNDVIPAGTGVVLKGDEGTYTFNITSESGVGDEDNALLGLDVEGTTVAPANDGDYYFYKLSTNSNGDASTVGFWLGAQDGGAFTLPAHKAYLAIKQSEGGSTPVSSFIFDETVGISSVAAQVNHADGVHTLSGVRVNGDNLPKGIYIMNGKKVVIK